MTTDAAAEAIKAVERLAAVDKVDWIVGLYGRASTSRRCRPSLSSAIRRSRSHASRARPQPVKKYPRCFSATARHPLQHTVIDILKNFRKSGQIGTRSRWSISPTSTASKSPTSASRNSRRRHSKSSTKNLSAGHAGYAPVIKGEGDQSGRVHRLVLSAGHFRPD